MTEGGDTWLAALQARLGTDAGEIARMLLSELDGAVAGIDAGLRDRDLEAVAQAAHAALSSALLLDDRGLMAALSDLEAAARALDPGAAGAARSRLGRLWEPARRRLERAAAPEPV